MSISEVLVILALTFLGLHLLFDLKALRQAVAHGKDIWWTAATLFVLGGHMILDMLH